MHYDARELARKFALKNALDYGKADTGAVLGKVLASHPELRKDIRAAAASVSEVVEQTNKMSREELEREFGAYVGEFEQKEREKAEKGAKPRMELDGAVVGKFATRFPPEPNGYMQVGHAMVTWLEREFADIYKGTLALYFDDTNPEKEKQEYVDGLKNDLAWLGVRFDREYYASDHIETLYGYARKLVNAGNAYVCTCDGERIKKLRFGGEACEHRERAANESAELLERMIKGAVDDGEAVLRLKLDMQASNTTLRDPVLLRVIKHSHYRQGEKYAAWPTYDFNTPVVDSVEGVTDAIRSKEYELRDELDMKILDMLGLRKPRIRSVARLEIRGNITSKRKTNELIAQGKLSGYDDPRLVTIAALRRRGIRPEAIRSFVLRFGMSKSEHTVPIDMLLAENREIIDGTAKRLFAVTEPVRVNVQSINVRSVTLRLHPSRDLGSRECSASGKLLISGSDARTLKQGSVFRFKDLVNVEVLGIGAEGVDAKAIGNEALDAPKFQWVDAERNVRCKLVEIGPLLAGDEFNAESLKEREAFAEEYANTLNKDDIVQFERIGFFKLDDTKEKKFIEL